MEGAMAQGSARTMTARVGARTRAWAPREQVKRPPLIRIHRFAHITDINNLVWDEYSNKIGRLNWEHEIFNLGKMACTYVPETSLNAMLADKYPNSYTHRKDILKIHS